MEQIKLTVDDLPNIRLLQADGEAKPKPTKDKPKPGAKRADKAKSFVTVLTDSNFDDLVFGQNKAFFVEFYAPWCGHCKKLAPDWESIAELLQYDVMVAKVDATVEKGLKTRFGIKSFPTLKFFPASSHTDDEVIPFERGQKRTF